jgi:hypothetical protein
MKGDAEAITIGVVRTPMMEGGKNENVLKSLPTKASSRSDAP